jgi:hypothetical protein
MVLALACKRISDKTCPVQNTRKDSDSQFAIGFPAIDLNLEPIISRGPAIFCSFRVNGTGGNDDGVIRSFKMV